MVLLYNLRGCQPIKHTKFHGGGRYGEVIFMTLAEKMDFIACYYDANIYINPDIIDICKSRNFKLYDSNSYSIAEVMKQGDYLLYSPLVPFDIINFPSHCKCIVTVHGLRFLETPYDRYMFAYCSPYAIKERIKYLYDRYLTAIGRAKYKRTYEQLFNRENIKYITVSNHSKYSLLSFFPSLVPDSIRMFYSPAMALPVSSSMERVGKYYLMTSGNRWTKNTIRAIIAFDTLFSERPTLEGKVVITGIDCPKLFYKYIKNRTRFILLDYVSYEKLASLYQNAYLFVYPTLNEGFGYPPIEAMQFATPVICSAITSTTEICGDSVLYFNPYSIDEIKNRILMMENPKIREFYVKKGIERYKFIAAEQRQALDDVTEFIISQL